MPIAVDDSCCYSLRMLNKSIRITNQVLSHYTETSNTPNSTLAELLTRHKNFPYSAKFIVLIDLSARDPHFLPTTFWWELNIII